MQHLSEMMLFLNYCIFSGSAEALVRCGRKHCHCFFFVFVCLILACCSSVCLCNHITRRIHEYKYAIWVTAMDVICVLLLD